MEEVCPVNADLTSSPTPHANMIIGGTFAIFKSFIDKPLMKLMDALERSVNVPKRDEVRWLFYKVTKWT